MPDRARPDPANPAALRATDQAAFQEQRDTLFYDGRCPLCADEIEALRRIRGDELALVDVHSLPRGQGPAAAAGNGPDDDAVAHMALADCDGTCDADAPAAAGSPFVPAQDRLLRSLHLRRADGSWLTGADANVAAWEGTGRGRLLTVLRWPLLRHVVDLAYAVWAYWRYYRLYGRQFEQEPSDDGGRRASESSGH
ncbi:MAG: DCC1-like thiol-disulfide oxidoreductase family protein [Halieaceae bacterium]|nr:DCC1-like thiol-disulfide oxidoreductase family protein [Halieaceae bacterium]